MNIGWSRVSAQPRLMRVQQRQGFQQLSLNRPTENLRFSERPSLESVLNRRVSEENQAAAQISDLEPALRAWKEALG